MSDNTQQPKRLIERNKGVITITDPDGTKKALSLYPNSLNLHVTCTHPTDPRAPKLDIIYKLNVVEKSWEPESITATHQTTVENGFRAAFSKAPSGKKDTIIPVVTYYKVAGKTSSSMTDGHASASALIKDSLRKYGYELNPDPNKIFTPPETEPAYAEELLALRNLNTQGSTLGLINKLNTITNLANTARSNLAAIKKAVTDIDLPAEADDTFDLLRQHNLLEPFLARVTELIKGLEDAPSLLQGDATGLANLLSDLLTNLSPESIEEAKQKSLKPEGHASQPAPAPEDNWVDRPSKTNRPKKPGDNTPPPEGPQNPGGQSR